MSDQYDKSEDATPFKLKEARKKGQVAKSPEFPAFFSLLMMVGFLVVNFDEFGRLIAIELGGWISSASFLAEDVGALSNHATNFVFRIAMFLLKMSLLGMLAFIAVSLVHAGPVFSAHPIKPDFSRVNPAKGFKRLFSRRTLVEFGKLVVKLGLFSLAFWVTFSGAYQWILDPSKAALGNVLYSWGSVAARFASYLLAVFLLSALFDLWFNKREFARQMKMSKRDVKDEYKRREGSPEIKQRQKRNQRELLAKLTSLHNLKDADVIITNPTKFAIALKYRANEMALPVVVSKGRGFIARTIRRKANRRSIPVTRNAKLARHLFWSVDIGQPIDLESQDEVARVYQWILTLPNNKVFS